MSEIGIAVVGTGYIGREHMKAIAAHSQARLEFICATRRSEAVAVELQGVYGAGRVSTDFMDVVGDEGVDVVYLCTPNSQHVQQAVEALEGGKHVFVEKPLAVTLAGRWQKRRGGGGKDGIWPSPLDVGRCRRKRRRRRLTL